MATQLLRTVQLARLEGDPLVISVSTLVASPDGRFLFVGTNTTIRQLETSNGEVCSRHRRKSLTLGAVQLVRTFPCPVRQLCVSPDGRFLCASFGKTVRQLSTLGGEARADAERRSILARRCCGKPKPLQDSLFGARRCRPTAARSLRAASTGPCCAWMPQAARCGCDLAARCMEPLTHGPANSASASFTSSARSAPWPCRPTDGTCTRPAGTTVRGM
jgi:hypothetical protein